MKKKIQSWLRNKLNRDTGINTHLLFATTMMNLGRILSSDREYGRGEMINTLVKHSTGKPICSDNSTAIIKWHLMQDKGRFRAIKPLPNLLKPGQIIITPTRDEVEIGNVGVIGTNMQIINMEKGSGKLVDDIKLDQWISISEKAKLETFIYEIR
jgi:hypothetical protein